MALPFQNAIAKWGSDVVNSGGSVWERVQNELRRGEDEGLYDRPLPGTPEAQDRTVRSRFGPAYGGLRPQGDTSSTPEEPVDKAAEAAAVGELGELVRSLTGGGGGEEVQAAAEEEIDPEAELRAEWKARRGELESQYQADVEELRELYQFAQTEDEKARLAQQLQALKGQLNAGLTAIDAGYDAARADVSARAGTVRGRAASEGRAIGDVYRGAASNIRADDAVLEDEFADTSMAVNQGGGTERNDDFAGLMDAAAPAEEALSRRMGEIAAEDISWLADSLTGESQAQQGDLQRMAMALQANAVASHNKQVADRINADRRAFGSQLASTRNAYRNRGWDLEDREYELLRQVEEDPMIPDDLARDLALADAVGLPGPARLDMVREHGYLEDGRNQGVARWGAILGDVLNALS